MSSIKSLDSTTVHRICSGQVIINIANAVKELVENSLDAGAKTIEVRLKKYGSESIDVIDDGPGITESDFQTITLKHYTSKIQQYGDLEALETFGFRGEALSSLCALCDLTITTRHSNTAIGKRLTYDKNGLIKTQENIARSVGTTVTLENIFYTLPVRHKEFLKNLKREYTKLIHVIQCYCLISEGIKISCFHILPDKSNKLMCTQSRNSLKDNIIEIFSLASFKSMISFEQVEPTDEILLEYKVKKSAANANLTNESNVIENADDKEGEKKNEQNNDTIHKKDNFGDLFQIEGFVSNCSHGLGRSTPDRQYIYVNKRPCDHSRLTKLMNEIYHQFNRNQYPMFILNINLDSHNVDVNVTPDKLQMFIKSENILLAIVKSSLQKMFSRLMENISLNDSSFQCQKSTMLEFFTSSSASTTKNSQMSKGNFKQLANETKEKADNSMIYQKRPRDEEDTSQLPKQPKLNNFLGLKKDKNSSYSPRKYSPAKNSPTRESPFKNSPPAPPSPHTNDTFTIKEKLNFYQNRIGSTPTMTLDDSVSERIDLHMCKRVNTPLSDREKMRATSDQLKSLGLTQTQIDHDATMSSSSNSSYAEINNPSEKIKLFKSPNKTTDEFSEANKSSSVAPMNSTLRGSSDKTSSEFLQTDEISFIKSTEPTVMSTQELMSKRKEKQLKFNWALVKQQHTEMIRKNENDLDKHLKDEEEKKLLKSLKFKSKNIESKDAENELDRCITKEDFLKMRVCGQFNKGFIISRLDQELFIVDQHAADEIYNFEMLQRNAKMDKQKLLQPRFLELTAAAEASLCDNLQLLEKAGYDLEVCASRKVGNRIMITAVPMSKQSNKLFDFKDIDELLFILSENELNAGSISSSSSEQSALTEIKSSSLRAMYASKACRKSIMIGTSLNASEMKRVITHLNEIDKPWNCPHGRPTMRHLINIELLRKKTFN